MANNGFDDVRSITGKAPGDRYSDEVDDKIAKANLPATIQEHELDNAESQQELRQVLEWYFLELEKQSENRLEMAMDADFYDNMQWDPEDAQALKDRGQMPLVYNAVAPMVDWLIGTERRSKVDWKVLPRTEDDVQLADIKTKTLKYVSDVNRVPFNRSRAFSDAAKVGVGWVDDGARDDPTQDIIYSKYEDWRNVLWDSACYELDLSDARYLFRWRWVDEDIAIAMFPDRKAAILQASEDAGAFFSENDELDTWSFNDFTNSNVRLGRVSTSGAGIMVDAKRRRVKLYECQWRKPTTVKIVADGPLRGAVFNEKDQNMAQVLHENNSTIIDKVMLRVHVGVFTESHWLSREQSLYRHNRFSLTAIWCYRRGKDRLPYGSIRRVRDIQQDLNKRASKALFMLNTNQIIADEGATDDWKELRDEADRPDGTIIKKAGKELKLQRDTDAATGQIQMMQLATDTIQRSVGVGDDNLGRQTNAISGEAIRARQLQGSVVTTEPFDNLRLAIQVQGEKQLSLIEQFYSEDKVIRLTGARGAIEWVKINQPEVQPDGSIRYLNDITASMADFVVSEQDFAGSMRQVMLDSMNAIVAKMPDPTLALRLFTVGIEYSDLPNKDDIANAIRQITGDRDPNKEMTPEELEQQEQQMRQQAEDMQISREQVLAALEEQKGKAREINARAAKLEAEAKAAGNGMSDAISNEVMRVKAQASEQIQALSAQLTKVQQDSAKQIMDIRKDNDSKAEAERIRADAQVRVAEIQAADDKKLQALQQRLDEITRKLDETIAGKTALADKPND